MDLFEEMSSGYDEIKFLLLHRLFNRLLLPVIQVMIQSRLQQVYSCPDNVVKEQYFNSIDKSLHTNFRIQKIDDVRLLLRIITENTWSVFSVNEKNISENLKRAGNKLAHNIHFNAEFTISVLASVKALLKEMDEKNKELGIKQDIPFKEFACINQDFERYFNISV